MSPVGPITHYVRRFLDGNSGVGFTSVTCGYGGWTVREFPQIGLKATQKLARLPFHQEVQLLYPKLYRITKADDFKQHPVFSVSHEPFLLAGEFLSRCRDGRISTRACNATRVSFYLYYCNFLIFSSLLLIF